MAGHLAAGLAVFRIASLLQGSAGASPRLSSVAWPSAAMILFLLWGTNVEAAAWVSGRYDVFATAFTLWAVAYHLHSQSALDRHALIALLFGVLALCSKESAAVLPGLIGCVARIRRGLLPRAARCWVVCRSGSQGRWPGRWLCYFRISPGCRCAARVADCST